MLKCFFSTKLGFILSTFFGVSVCASSGSGIPIPVMVVKDAIHLGTVQYLERVLTVAEAQKSPAIIIKLDTPGGYLDSTREIVQTFLSLKSTKVIVWVSPSGAHAASAGTMITMAAHYAAMAPATSIGAASPVVMGNEMPETIKKKMTNDTVSFVEGIAKERGRNMEWAKKSVTDAASVSAEEALKNKVIDGVHADLNSVWEGARNKYGDLPKTASFYEIDLTLKENILSFISNPNVSYGLLALGVMGIYLELSSPGVGVGGVIGVVSLALGAFSLKIIPFRPASLILLAIGFVLFALEIFTPLPTFGVAGVLGVVCMVLSGIFLMDAEQTNLNLSLSLWGPIAAVALLFVFYFAFVAGKSLKTHEKGRLLEGLVGQKGVVTRVLGPAEYKIKTQGGELWKAILVSSNPVNPLQTNDEVVIEGYEGFVLKVKAKV